MLGFITENELDQAEAAFPGIVRYFESLSRRPQTFLELLALFDGWTSLPATRVTTPALARQSS
jgi:hypothetical protein